MTDLGFDDELEAEPERAGSRARRWFRIAITLTVIAAMVVLAALEGSGFIIRGDAPAPTPSITVPAARIAVVDANGALVAMDRDGSSVAAYAAPGVDFQFPAWSPDGSHIAAVGAGSEGSGVYVFGARASTDPPSEPVVIYESADRPPFYLYWTPDSRQVTFLTTEPDGLALRVAPADGSAAASTVRAGAPMYWDFVDPGRLLVHSGLSGPDGFLGEVGLDGVPPAPGDLPLADGGAPGVFRAPGVSRDGRYRAYVAAGDGAAGEIVREARDGSSSNRVRVFGPAAVSFSPVSDELAFVAPDQATAEALPLPVGPLRLMDAASATARTLVTGNVVAFMWAPSGKEIAVLRLDRPDDNVTEARQRVVTALARIGAPATETAAGLPLRLAFVEVATGSIRSERGVRLSDVFVNQVLPFFDQYALSHRFWSRDSAAIVLPIVGDGDATQLFVIPADGSEARPVANGEMGFWSP